MAVHTRLETSSVTWASEAVIDDGSDNGEVAAFRAVIRPAFRGTAGTLLPAPEDHVWVGESPRHGEFRYRAALRIRNQEYLDFQETPQTGNHWKIDLRVAEINHEANEIVRWLDPLPAVPTVTNYRDALFPQACGASDNGVKTEPGGVDDGLADAGRSSWGRVSDTNGEFYGLLSFPELGLLIPQFGSSNQIYAIDIAEDNKAWSKHGWSAVPANAALWRGSDAQGFLPPWVEGAQATFDDKLAPFAVKRWSVLSKVGLDKILVLQTTVDIMCQTSSAFHEATLAWTATQLRGTVHPSAEFVGSLTGKWFGAESVFRTGGTAGFACGAPIRDLAPSCGGSISAPLYERQDPYLADDWSEALVEEMFEGPEVEPDPEDPEEEVITSNLPGDLKYLREKPYFSGFMPYNEKCEYQILDAATGTVLASLDLAEVWGEKTGPEVNYQGEGASEIVKVVTGGSPSPATAFEPNPLFPDLPSQTYQQRNLWLPKTKLVEGFAGGAWEGENAGRGRGMLGLRMQGSQPQSGWSAQCASIVGNTIYIKPAPGHTPQALFELEVDPIEAYYIVYLYWQIATGAAGQRVSPGPLPFHSGKCAVDPEGTRIWLFPKAAPSTSLQGLGVAAHNVFAATTHRIVCLDAETLEVLWQKSVLEVFGAAPVASNGKKVLTHGAMVSNPVATASRVGGVFLTKDGEHLALWDKVTGKLSARLQLGTRSVSSTVPFPGTENGVSELTAGNGDVLILSSYGRVRGVGRRDGQLGTWVLKNFEDVAA